MESRRTQLEGTDSAADALKRVRFQHDAIIDMIIAEPGISQGALAAAFGFTEAWISRVINSDAFNVMLAQRKQELIDPTLIASVEERLREAATLSLDVVIKKLKAAPTLDQALKAVEVTSKALGYGARTDNSVNINTNYVVALPDRSQDAATWAAQHTPKSFATSIPTTVDAEIVPE